MTNNDYDTAREMALEGDPVDLWNQLQNVRTLVSKWRISEPRIGTHWKGCDMVHTDCLVLAIRDALGDHAG
jgi:hypothetical protein